MATPQDDALTALRCSETVIPATPLPTLPALPKPDLPAPHGTNIILLIPTANKAKNTVIREYVERHAPPGAAVFAETVPADSGVGEQPYNSAGAQGAMNRIANALGAIPRERLAALTEQHAAGSVVVGAIENFVRTGDIDADRPPADHAVAVVYNASTGCVAAACSRGVTLRPEYVGWATELGFVEGNPDHGCETVGNMLAARFPGLDGKNWHEVLGGLSRYALLREALENLGTSWW